VPMTWVEWAVLIFSLATAGEEAPHRAVKRLVNKVAPKRGEKSDPDGDGERLW